MKHFSKWLEGKTPAVSFIAKMLLPDSSQAYEVLKIGIRQVMPGIHIPIPFQIWRKCYRTYSRTINQTFGQAFKDKPKYDEQNPASAKAVSAFLSSLGTDAHKVDWQKWLTDGLATLGEQERIAVQSGLLIWLRFAYDVLLPCWLILGETPTSLRRKARQGDIEALDNLLRLDKSMVGEKRVHMWWHAIVSGTNEVRKDRLLTAIASPLNQSIKPARFKMATAALLLLVADAEGCRLTIPDLRNAFDAIAKDKSDRLTDPDLPRTPHAFYVGVSRERAALLERMDFTASEWRQRWAAVRRKPGRKSSQIAASRL